MRSPIDNTSCGCIMEYHADEDVVTQGLSPSEHHDEECSSGYGQDQLISRIYSCLPWELRHHIHTFCVQGCHDDEVVVRRRSLDSPNLLVRQPVGTHSYRWAEDSTFRLLSPDRIGLAASREMMETYYRIRTFKFAHEELEFLQSFLEQDTFGLSLRPADHLHHLHLQIEPFMHAQLKIPQLKHNRQTICCRALESLAAVRSSNAAIEVHVDLAQGYFDEEEFDELLNEAAAFVFRIAKVVDTLRMTGLKIGLILDGTWDKKSGMKLCSSSIPSFEDCAASIKIACQ